MGGRTSATRWCHHQRDRKSTRLNSSHVKSSYAVFCLKKKIPRPSVLLSACETFKERSFACPIRPNQTDDISLLHIETYVLQHVPRTESLGFFFNDTATTEIYTLSLHDALPIYIERVSRPFALGSLGRIDLVFDVLNVDRKSTRLNSSHVKISYAVFCLKTKKTHEFPAHSRKKKKKQTPKEK